jgi:hypothetical protein
MPSVKLANWNVSYYWSKSSGLRLANCDFHSERVLHSASVPFVYVNYQGDSSGPFTDELKSLGDVEVREIMFGFDLKVTYDFYGEDYQYEHVWRFHEDGQFGSAIVIQGPGEEILGRHIYHVPFRFDLDLSGASGDSFQRLGPDGWADVKEEGRHTPVAPPAYDWRVIDKKSGRSARVRARSQDNGELWALRYKEAESWGSWSSAGAGAPGSPGSVPAVYANAQGVQNTNVVLWYVAHKPSVELPVVCGPWFSLEGFPHQEPPEEVGGHGGMDHHDDPHHDGGMDMGHGGGVAHG